MKTHFYIIPEGRDIWIPTCANSLSAAKAVASRRFAKSVFVSVGIQKADSENGVVSPVSAVSYRLNGVWTNIVEV